MKKESRNSARPSATKAESRAQGPPVVSTFAVLTRTTPGVGFGKGGPRGSLPPELPAGKRGGWHHDSVYPSFRLTSFAPRALNFSVSVPVVRSALDFSLDATQICRRTLPPKQ